MSTAALDSFRAALVRALGDADPRPSRVKVEQGAGGVFVSLRRADGADVRLRLAPADRVPGATFATPATGVDTVDGAALPPPWRDAVLEALASVDGDAGWTRLLARAWRRAPGAT